MCLKQTCACQQCWLLQCIMPCPVGFCPVFLCYAVPCRAVPRCAVHSLFHHCVRACLPNQPTCLPVCLPACPQAATGLNPAACLTLVDILASIPQAANWTQLLKVGRP